MGSVRRIAQAFFLLAFFLSAVLAQGPLLCTPSATPLMVRSEGVAERLGDIFLSCTGGTPGAVVTGNLTLALTVPITNRLTPGTATDILVTVDTGSGPVPVPFSAQLISFQTVSLNGISFTIPPGGGAGIRISNLRGTMPGAAPNQFVQAFLGGSPSFIAIPGNPVSVGVPLRSLQTNATSTVIRCFASPVPSTISLSALFDAGTHFESTRFTEGFASAFQPKGPLENSGTRMLVRYTNLPPGVRLFVPNAIAGSDAAIPTGGGDLGQPQSGGSYVPGSGTLLLVLVPGADSNGNGGVPMNVAAGAGVVFDGATELAVINSAAYAVYEVVDANSTVVENAQFPTFVGLASITASSTAQETVTLAPLSTDSSASSTASIPRFAPLTPPSDCQTVGDCGASYYPSLRVIAPSLQFSAYQGGLALQPPGYIPVQNANVATSVLNWTASVIYQNGSDWITLSPDSGFNNATIRVDIHPEKLAPALYNGTIVIDGGAIGGTQRIPVVLIVTAFPTPPVVPPTPPPVIRNPGIVSIANAANQLPGPVASGSVVAILGSRFTGKNISVTFDGVAAQVVRSSDTQIIVIVPAFAQPKSSSQVIVSVDGLASQAQTVALAEVAPAIFPDLIRNQDYTTNNTASGAPVGTFVRVFVTGIPAAAATTVVKVHDRDGLAPLSVTPLDGWAGIVEVDAPIPADLPAMTTTILVCAVDSGANKVCSAPAPLTLADAAVQ